MQTRRPHTGAESRCRSGARALVSEDGVALCSVRNCVTGRGRVRPPAGSPAARLLPAKHTHADFVGDDHIWMADGHTAQGQGEMGIPGLTRDGMFSA